MSDTDPDGTKPADVTPTEAPVEVVDAELIPLEPTTFPATAASPVEETGYTSSGVPTFDYAREKIENRYGTAIGAAELAAETPEGRSVEEQYEARQKAAAERLAEIRDSMRGDRPDDA